MNHYIKEVHRISKLCFSNKEHIQIAVETRKYIDSNFEKDINLDSLAQLNLVSKYHLLRIFKRYYGVTPRQYMIAKRLEEAKKLLKEGETVSNTCYSVGFESLNSFSNLFKSKTGQTPSAYRQATFDKLESR